MTHELHRAAREAWLLLQAGPRYVERRAAYLHMASLAAMLRRTERTGETP